MTRDDTRGALILPNWFRQIAAGYVSLLVVLVVPWAAWMTASALRAEGKIEAIRDIRDDLKAIRTNVVTLSNRVARLEGRLGRKLDSRDDEMDSEGADPSVWTLTP